jgi:hypothetical protein
MVRQLLLKVSSLLGRFPGSGGTLAVLLLLGVGVSCAKKPVVVARAPWTRTSGSPRQLQPGMNLQIAVAGQTGPLLGSEDLLQQQLSEKLSALLQRRGYVVGDAPADFKLILTYKTERTDKLVSRVTSSQSMGSASGAAATQGYLSLGVAVAQSVGSTSQTSMTTSTELHYVQTISIEAVKGTTVVWKGESTWDSFDLDILKDVRPAFQKILSHLPYDPDRKTSIAELKETHTKNFYNLSCRNRWYASPALPYRVRFTEFYTENYNSNSSMDLPSCIKNPTALAAYEDLIETAEYAVPRGVSSKYWDNPLNPDLWSKVELGRKYTYPNGKSVNVIIKLYGKAEGYLVDECKVVSDSEFEAFDTDMKKWWQALENYYNVFQR